jgi:hypothetical protein
MLRTFAEDGLAFDYPAHWKFDREKGEDGWAVTLQSPGAAFAVVRLERDMPDAAEVVEASLATLRGVYPALEATSALETIAGEMAVGHDIEFFSLDIANLAWTRCFFGPAGTVLVLCQCSDVDEAGDEAALHAISASMRIEE